MSVGVFGGLIRQSLYAEASPLDAALNVVRKRLRERHTSGDDAHIGDKNRHH